MAKLAGQLRARQTRTALISQNPGKSRNEMMEQALNKRFNRQIALELAQLCPGGAESPAPSLPRRSVAKQYPHAAYSLLSPAGAAASRLSPRPRRAASGRTNLCRADALRRRRQYADRRSGAPLAGLPGRPALAFLYPLHAVLAQWRYGGNRAVATADAHRQAAAFAEPLFASINRIDIFPVRECLLLTPSPDYWLPFRLASYCSVLAHPTRSGRWLRTVPPEAV